MTQQLARRRIPQRLIIDALVIAVSLVTIGMATIKNVPLPKPPFPPFGRLGRQITRRFYRTMLTAHPELFDYFNPALASIRRNKSSRL
jgi:hypothetical protein